MPVTCDLHLNLMLANSHTIEQPYESNTIELSLYYIHINDIYMCVPVYVEEYFQCLQWRNLIGQNSVKLQSL